MIRDYSAHSDKPLQHVAVNVNVNGIMVCYFTSQVGVQNNESVFACTGKLGYFLVLSCRRLIDVLYGMLAWVEHLNACARLFVVVFAYILLWNF
mgnify:CR=1 FL=1